jgi:hypothetical protein
MHQLFSVSVLDVRQAEIGGDRGGGNDRERGKRAVIETDKVRNWVRVRGFGCGYLGVGIP